MFSSLRAIVAILSFLSLSCGVFSACSNTATPNGTGHVNWPGTELVIPREAFDDCLDVKSISIPASVTKIGKKAFFNASALEVVDFEAVSTLRIIGQEAFRQCTSLITIKIPASVTTLGRGAFFGAESMSSVEFEAGISLKTIGARAFRNCTSLTTIEIPAPVEEIGLEAFLRATALSSITFETGSQLNTIDARAFKDCSSLCKISIPDDTEIGDEAFKNGKYEESLFTPGAVLDLCPTDNPSLDPSSSPSLVAYKPFNASPSPSCPVSAVMAAKAYIAAAEEELEAAVVAAVTTSDTLVALKAAVDAVTCGCNEVV